MDEKYVAKSYKGNRSLQKDFSMDRKARKRGSEVHTPGLSKEQVCIETAMDEYGVSVARIAGLGVPSANRIRNAIQIVHNAPLFMQYYICTYYTTFVTLYQGINE